MKPRSKPLYQQADHYLLVGDATAIPVLGAILESLPTTAKGQCLIEVHGPADEQALANPANLAITWLHNPHPDIPNNSQLADTVKSLSLPTGSRFAYITSEYASIKAIRHYLKVEKNWTKDEFFASSYWKAGSAEDKSAAERRAERNNSNNTTE